MSTCEICEREFEYSRSKGHTKTKCNSCSTNLRRFALREKIINYMGGQCAKCGYARCYGVLHPHHLEPTTKEFKLSGAHSRSWKKITEEMDKCILLCANCHFEDHHPCHLYGCPGTVEGVVHPTSLIHL